MHMKNVPKFPHPTYSMNQPWENLEEWIAYHNERGMSLNMDPEFQRGYVWTDEQKTKYLEYALRGGFSGRDIYFNCSTWMRFSGNDKITLIDGKQRINAVLDFLHDKVKVFGDYYSDWEILHEKSKTRLGFDAQFIIHIHDIKSEIEVVRWYLGMNNGGTAHTKKDIKIAEEYLNKLLKEDAV